MRLRDRSRLRLEHVNRRRPTDSQDALAVGQHAQAVLAAVGGVEAQLCDGKVVAVDAATRLMPCQSSDAGADAQVVTILRE